RADGKADPPTLDILDHPRGKGGPLRWLYKLDGDTLNVCLNLDDDTQRPAALEAGKASKNWILTFRRVKPKKGSATDAGRRRTFSLGTGEMRARALRLVRRAGLIGAALFAGAWVASGGLVVERSASLHQFPYHGGNPLVEVEVANRPAPAGVPLVARDDPDRAPFGVRVTHISHKVVEEPSITVDECYLTLPDGKRVDLTEPVRAGLVPAPFEHEYQSYVGDQERVPALRSQVTVPNCLPLDGLFRFQILG